MPVGNVQPASLLDSDRPDKLELLLAQSRDVFPTVVTSATLLLMLEHATYRGIRRLRYQRVPEAPGELQEHRCQQRHRLASPEAEDLVVRRRLTPAAPGEAM